MKRLSSFIIPLFMLFSSPANADAFNVNIGVKVWDMASEGSLSDGKLTAKTDEFDFFDEDQTHYYITLEHPIPLIPNFRVSHSEMVTEGTKKFPIKDTFLPESEMDFTYTDYTVYYQLFDMDNFELDFGATARNFEGEFKTREEIGITEEMFDDYMPMVYLATTIGTPIDGLSFFALGNGAVFEDHHFVDYELGVRYVLIETRLLNLALQGGYQEVSLELEDMDSIYTNMDFKGAFAGIELQF